MLICSCSKDENVLPEEIPKGLSKELSNYFKTQDFKDLRNNFSITLNNLDFDKLSIQEFDDIDASIFYIPVTRGNDYIGEVCIVYKKENDKILYKSLYEDRSSMLNAKEGLIYVYTGQGLFVADLKFTKQNDNLVAFTINNVANEKNIPVLKSGAEWPQPDEPWWSCTTKCYSYAKQACGDLDTCDILCDLINLGGMCTITISAACAIYCVGV